MGRHGSCMSIDIVYEVETYESDLCSVRLHNGKFPFITCTYITQKVPTFFFFGGQWQIMRSYSMVYSVGDQPPLPFALCSHKRRTESDHSIVMCTIVQQLNTHHFFASKRLSPIFVRCSGSCFNYYK